MSGNEEADAAAGTPDEGKKLTFAERRSGARRGWIRSREEGGGDARTR